MQKGQGHSVGEQNGGEDALGRQERPWASPVHPRRNEPGKPLPQHQQRLGKTSHPGPLRPLAALNFGLSLHPRAIAFTGLV